MLTKGESELLCRVGPGTPLDADGVVVIPQRLVPSGPEKRARSREKKERAIFKAWPRSDRTPDI